LLVGHFQFSILVRETYPSFDEIQCVTAEFFITPTSQEPDAFAFSRDDAFQVIGPSKQAGCDIHLRRTNFEQQFEQIRHQGIGFAIFGAAANLQRQIIA
jgi:hypothetical protein